MPSWLHPNFLNMDAEWEIYDFETVIEEEIFSVQDFLYITRFSSTHFQEI